MEFISSSTICFFLRTKPSSGETSMPAREPYSRFSNEDFGLTPQGEALPEKSTQTSGIFLPGHLLSNSPHPSVWSPPLLILLHLLCCLQCILSPTFIKDRLLCFHFSFLLLWLLLLNKPKGEEGNANFISLSEKWKSQVLLMRTPIWRLKWLLDNNKKKERRIFNFQ